MRSPPAEASNRERHTLTSTETVETHSGLAGSGTSGAEDSEHANREHVHSAAPHEHREAAPPLNPECTRQVEIEVPAGEVSRQFESVTKRYQKAARIPGFRAGKTPVSVIRSRFAEQIRHDVVEALLPLHFRNAIAQQNLQPVSQPQVTNLDLDENRPLRFTALFEVMPEIKIDGYGEVKVEKPDTALSDAEFNEELARLRDAHATMVADTADRTLSDGDFAEISFTGVLQAQPSDAAAPAAGAESPTADQPITGKDVLIEIGGKDTLDSFNSALRGTKAGQQLKFEVTYPAEFGERRLAGKTVAYDVEVKGIRNKVLPELDDAFAKSLGPYDSYAVFQEKFREHLAEEKRRRLETETKDRIVDALAARFNFPVPESLVQQQIDARLDRGLRALAAQGMRPDDMRKLDFDRLRAAQRDSAIAEVKGTLLLDRIADQEHIEVEEDEVERELATLSMETHEPPDTLLKRLTDNGGLARIREQLRRRNVGDLLYSRLTS